MSYHGKPIANNNRISLSKKQSTNARWAINTLKKNSKDKDAYRDTNETLLRILEENGIQGITSFRIVPYFLDRWIEEYGGKYNQMKLRCEAEFKYREKEGKFTSWLKPNRSNTGLELEILDVYLQK